MASRPIDEKIVVMKLDNSDFKQKAVETTGLFGKLKSSLNKIPGVNLGKTVQDLNGIKSAAGGTNLNGLTNSIQGVQKGFSAMTVVATTALATITNKAVNAGMALGKSLSLDQLKEGFDEYELKMGSIQTILANTSKHGTTLSDVSKSLNKLNEYADKTIYNFGDMTKNIGLFTNAGLKLEESTSMIKGFSNMAAASGTTSANAAGAAYQLSQGLSQGYIMAMDWMSLSNAGMGNDNMKNDLIALGKAMGTLKQTGEHTLKNWKEVLTDDRWLTTEVMSTYLQTMAGDIGAAELKTLGLNDAQIKLMLTNAKMGEEAATKVRTFTQLMDTLKEGIGSGWAESFEQIFGDFDEATVLWSGVSDKIGASIDQSSEARNKFLKSVADKGGFLNIFEGVENMAKPVIQVFGALGDGFRKVFPPASVSTVLKLTESFKKFTEGLTLSKERVSQLTTIFQGTFSIFSTVWELAKRLTLAFVKLIPEGSGGQILNFVEWMAQLAINFNESVKQGNALTSFISGMGKSFAFVSGFISNLGSNVLKLGSFIKENFGGAISWVVEKLKPVGAYLKEAFGGSYGDEAVGAGFLVALYAIVKKITGFFDKEIGIFDSIGDMVDGVSETLGGIGEAINNFATSIKYVNLIMIATAIGILAVSLKVLEGISVADIAKGITTLSLSLGVMIAGMMAMSKFNVSGGLRVSATLIALATATTIMAVALKTIGSMDLKSLIKGVAGLTSVVAILSVSLIAMSKFGGKVKVGSLQLMALATSVMILASAIKTMSSIKAGDLVKSVGAMAVIFGSLAIFLKVVDRTKLGVGSSLGILVVASAIKVMVSAITDIASIRVNGLIKGLATISAILTVMTVFSKVAGGPQLLIAGTGMIAMAAGIRALVGPVTAFSEMKWKELAKGMAGMAGSLVILAGAAYLMTGGIAGAAGVIAMAIGLKMLVPTVERFAAMSWGEMIKGFVGLAAGLTLVSVAALLITPAIPSMLGLGVALLAMGAAMLAAGVGMSLFGAGLTTLATLTATSVAAIIGALGLIIQGLGSLIGDAVMLIVNFGSALIDGLVVLIPKLVLMGGRLAVGIFEGMAEYVPKMVTAGGDLVVGFINGMSEQIPRVMEAVTGLMVNIAIAVEENSGPFLNAWLTIMSEVAVVMVRSGAAVIDALFGWIPGVGEVTRTIGAVAENNIREAFDAQKVAVDKGTEFASGLNSTQGSASTAGAKLGNMATIGAASANMNPVGYKHGVLFSSGLNSTQGMVRNSGVSLANGASSGANTLQLNPIGSNAGMQFANGLSSKTSMSSTAGMSLATSGKTGASSVSMSTTGKDFGLGFSNGISLAYNSVVAAGKSLARKAKNAVAGWLDIQSPSRVMMKDGGFFGEGFALGISNSSRLVGNKAKNLAMTARESINGLIETFQIPVEDNTIRFKAVVDYEDLDSRKFGDLSTIRPDTSYAKRLITDSKRATNTNDISDNSHVARTDSNSGEGDDKRPAIIQVVTPEKREVARWLVDDITDFQDFKMATDGQF